MPLSFLFENKRKNSSGKYEKSLSKHKQVYLVKLESTVQEYMFEWLFKIRELQKLTYLLQILVCWVLFDT